MYQTVEPIHVTKLRYQLVILGKHFAFVLVDYDSWHLEILSKYHINNLFTFCSAVVNSEKKNRENVSVTICLLFCHPILLSQKICVFQFFRKYVPKSLVTENLKMLLWIQSPNLVYISYVIR